MKIKKIALLLLIAIFVFSANVTYLTYAEEVEVEESDEPATPPSGGDSDGGSSGGGDTKPSTPKSTESTKKKSTSSSSSGTSNSNSNNGTQTNTNSSINNTTNANDTTVTNNANNGTTTVVKAKDISDIDVYVSAPGIKHYNGSEQKWSPVLKYKSHKLTNGVDYTVSYDTDNFVDAQVIHVTITGIGSYKGKVKTTYEILPKKITYTAKSATKEAGSKDPDFKYTCSSKKDVVKDDLIITRIEGEDEGDYTILITGPKVTKDHNYIINYKNATLSIEID